MELLFSYCILSDSDCCVIFESFYLRTVFQAFEQDSQELVLALVKCHIFVRVNMENADDSKSLIKPDLNNLIRQIICV